VGDRANAFGSLSLGNYGFSLGRGDGRRQRRHRRGLVVELAREGAQVADFSKALAREWGVRGVRFNTIAPGWIVPHRDENVGPSSFWNRFGFAMMGTTGAMQSALEAGAVFNMKDLPIRRLGRPEDIARLVMFLASDRSSYITGQLISDGGGAYMP